MTPILSAVPYSPVKATQWMCSQNIITLPQAMDLCSHNILTMPQVLNQPNYCVVTVSLQCIKPPNQLSGCVVTIP